ncbi:MAG: restriction endonuclease subunit S, partial [Chromatiaceae bacterium]|nr:restriction endonuclease subunit S [Chromatiaceae bacterium]
MSKQMQGRVPRLRFPAFREAAEWQEILLSELIDALDAGVSVNSGDRSATADESGILKTSAVTDGVFDFSENKVVTDAQELKRLKEPVTKNTIIISRMNTPALVGANAYVESDYANLFLPDRLWAAKPKPETSMRFIAYILGSGQGRAALSALATGTSGSMKNIAKSNILELQLVTPSPAEQQKIASCLSSLDALIAAHADKLDALKTNKKGLMQQLFPREGETFPRLRFSEFREAGEWGEKKLSELFAFRNGLNADKEKYGKGHKYISVLDIISGKPITYNSIHSSVEITEKELELFKVEYGDIVFQRSSETQDEAGQASVYLDRKKAAIFGGFVIRGKRISDYHPLFMSALLASSHVRKEISSHSAGSTRYNIGQETLSVIAVLIPSLPEQQKIAACLCSLDALIT